MFRFSRPPAEQIRRFLAAQKSESLSYPEAGASRAGSPPGYTVDHHRFYLGEGQAVFDSACLALRRWSMFELGWVQLLHPETAPEVGATVGILVRHFGFFSLNAARVVYIIDAEEGAIRTFGFAYGTLPAHAECGEERFSVEWNLASGAVHYDLLAFSRPAHPLARLGYPLARNLQKRFARDSGRAMIRAVR
ncbi:MAG: DUF1990 domain-containing protein [Bryobacteraceae bacterium]